MGKKSAATKKTSEAIGTVYGSYRVTECIAEGGCGQTFKGEHVETGLPVCIKDCGNVPEEFNQVLYDEAVAMWDLRHFSIPAIRDLIKKEDGTWAMVMSYIPGRTLAQLVEEHGRMDAESVAWIMERALNALLYLHMHGVMHGDVKPHNIIVQEETHMVVLVDFGLAMCKPKTDDVSIGHTPQFAPPEQEEELGPLLPESDLYSLGMTAIYALGGGYDAVKNFEVPKTVPAPLRKFIQRLIVRDVTERPNWTKNELYEEFKKVRLESFKRLQSGMKKITSGA